VLGSWRPQPSRPPAEAIAALRARFEALRRAPPAVQVAAVAAAAGLAATELAPALIDVVRDAAAPEDTRLAALALLEAWRHPSLAAAAELVARDASPALRLEAFRVLAVLDPETAMPALQAVIAGGTVAEQRAALRALAAIGDEPAVPMLAAWLERLLEGLVPAEVQLDLLEAAAARESPELADRVARYQARKPADDPLSPYAEALAGGDREAGRALFTAHTAANCVRCHRLGGEGGESAEGAVGPDLDGVGSRLGRRELLESLIEPSRAVAAGFGTVAVTLQDGTVHGGLLLGEDDRTLRLLPAGRPEIAFPIADIRQRTAPVSAMPPMGAILTLRELRDLVEFLASL
jgi:quinoprotein glucose dehydrogenase